MRMCNSLNLWLDQICTVRPQRRCRQPKRNPLPKFMAAFSTASRLRLLFALSTVERTVDELAKATTLSSSAVSQQLRVLRLLHLVRARRDGRHMRYTLFDDHVADLLAAIRHHGEHVANPPVALRRAVETQQSIRRTPMNGATMTITRRATRTNTADVSMSTAGTNMTMHIRMFTLAA